MLRELCHRYTDLTDSDIEILESIEKTLKYFSLMLNTDMFIDCFFRDETKAVVVAHERPETNSQYKERITGQYVLPQNEPIVFAARNSGVVIRDEKAFTQENKVVLQRVVPVKNDEGTIIAVIIQESDITGNVQMKKKMEMMGQTTEKLTTLLLNDEGDGAIGINNGVEINDLIVSEMHHRIKNNLQMVSSILNMQARRSRSEETKQLLREDMNRINSIALIHEALLIGDVGTVNLKALVERFAALYRLQLENGPNDINIEVEGDDISVDSAKATSIMLVINELVTNAVTHAFGDDGAGSVRITMLYGKLFSSVIVADDGMGIADINDVSGNTYEEKIGIKLIRKLVEEKLAGHISFSSDESGTRVLFDFSS